MRKMNLSFVSILVSLAVLAAIFCVIFFSIDKDSYEAKRTQQVKEIVVSSVAQCYALEGRYPDDLTYLQENYGLQLDADRYIYHYEKFASNILPDVQVFAIAHRGE